MRAVYTFALDCLRYKFRKLFGIYTDKEFLIFFSCDFACLKMVCI